MAVKTLWKVAGGALACVPGVSRWPGGHLNLLPGAFTSLASGAGEPRAFCLQQALNSGESTQDMFVALEAGPERVAGRKPVEPTGQASQSWNLAPSAWCSQHGGSQESVARHSHPQGLTVSTWAFESDWSILKPPAVRTEK